MQSPWSTASWLYKALEKSAIFYSWRLSKLFSGAQNLFGFVSSRCCSKSKLLKGHLIVFYPYSGWSHIVRQQIQPSQHTGLSISDHKLVTAVINLCCHRLLLCNPSYNIIASPSACDHHATSLFWPFLFETDV